MKQITHEEYIAALNVCNCYLKQTLTQVESATSEKTIKDFINENKDLMSQRLINVLSNATAKGYVYVSELTTRKLLSVRSCGEKSIDEFKKLIGNGK
jgi:DNA-directed RNA polymerase alpha subunit